MSIGEKPSTVVRGQSILFCCFFFYILVYVSLATGAVCRCVCCHCDDRHHVAHVLGCLHPLPVLSASPLVSLLHHFCYHELFFLAFPTLHSRSFLPLGFEGDSNFFFKLEKLMELTSHRRETGLRGALAMGTPGSALSWDPSMTASVLVCWCRGAAD